MQRDILKRFLMGTILCSNFCLLSTENSKIAQRYEDIAPKEVPYDRGKSVQPEEEIISVDRKKVLVKQLRALIFTDYSHTGDGRERADRQGIYIVGVKIPQEENFKRQMQKYLQKPVTLDLIETIRDEVIAYYHQQKISSVKVLFSPYQKISSGSLHYIIDSKVEK
ncbi:MAG: hypothetical protein JW769_04010 [Parachlamydiales bacterium]|nr:hypothetical protein [Parachlamydiales bacterium]